MTSDSNFVSGIENVSHPLRASEFAILPDRVSDVLPSTVALPICSSGHQKYARRSPAGDQKTLAVNRALHENLLKGTSGDVSYPLKAAVCGMDSPSRASRAYTAVSAGVSKHGPRVPVH